MSSIFIFNLTGISYFSLTLFLFFLIVPNIFVQLYVKYSPKYRNQKNDWKELINLTPADSFLKKVSAIRKNANRTSKSASRRSGGGLVAHQANGDRWVGETAILKNPSIGKKYLHSYCQ